MQHAPCPVFVTGQTSWRSKSRRPFIINTILVPVDFSGCSLEGLNYAIQWAEKFAAKILVLNVLDLGISFTSDGYGMHDLSKYREMARKEADRQMRKFVQATKFGGVKFETVVLVGPSVDEICTFAQNQDVDLIITSTHGRTGFKHVLIGSTAEQVVRRANRPVLVVPSHPEIRAAQLTRPTRKVVGNRASKRQPIEGKQFAKKDRKHAAHAFPERRRTNKFRESHSS